MGKRLTVSAVSQTVTRRRKYVFNLSHSAANRSLYKKVNSNLESNFAHLNLILQIGFSVGLST